MEKQELWKLFFVIFHDLSVESFQELVVRPLPWTCGTTLESVWTHSQFYLDHLSSFINIFLNIFKSLQPLVMKLSSCWHSPRAGSEKQGFSLPINPRCFLPLSSSFPAPWNIQDFPGFVQHPSLSQAWEQFLCIPLIHLQSATSCSFSCFFFFLCNSLRPKFSFGLSKTGLWLHSCPFFSWTKPGILSCLSEALALPKEERNVV